MSVFEPFVGMPGFSGEKIAKHRPIAADGYLQFLPGGVILDGTKARDPDNPDYSATNPTAQFRLRAGLLVGKASNGKWSNSVLGVTNGALIAASTTLTLASAQEGVELVRRLGASGTLKLTGPATAGGPVRTAVVTYSAVNTTNGQVTITAVGTNEVQTVAVDATMTAGKIDLTAIDSNGVPQTVNVAFNTSWAQTVADIQTALNALLGTSAVACAVTNTHDLTITFSGTGYAALPQSLVSVDISAATGPTKVTVTRTTAAADGRFVTGSLVQPADGSETIRSFLPDGWEMYMPLDSSDAPLDKVPVEGNVDMSQLLPWPADASLQQWVRDQLNAYGKFVDTSKY